MSVAIHSAGQPIRPFEQRRRRVRRGSLYITVAGVAGIVSLMACCAMTLARTQLRTAVNQRDWHSARQMAQSGVELAIAVLNTDSSWRTKYQLGVEYAAPAASRGNGTLAWKLTDLGGGELRVDGIGRQNRAACVISVDVQTSGESPLQVAILTGGGILLDSSSDSLTVQGSAAATNAAVNNLGTIVGNVEAQAHAGNLPVGGTLTMPGPLRAVPDETEVFAHYAAQGTDITSAVADSGFRIRNALLSPYANPYGMPNPHGIYVVRLSGGTRLTIESCRIVGTLVVLNATTSVEVINEVNWEPAYPNYPSLLVQGSLYIGITGGKVSESKTQYNLNPPFTPWQGTTNSVLTDNYPSSLAGIIYCTGNMTFDGKNSALTMDLQGCLLAGGTCRLLKAAKVTVRYEDTYLKSVPPGFGSYDSPVIQAGSWRQVPSY